MDHYKNLVFGLVSRGISDRSRPEDLAQEVFFRVYRGPPYFRGDARLSTWIYRIVQNVCVEERQRGRSHLPLDDLGPASQPRIVDRAFATIEIRDRIDKALATLVRSQVLTLYAVTAAVVATFVAWALADEG